jgi:sugar lactone lactonase YvrE
MLLSSSTNNAVERLSRSGKVTTLVAVPSPGQLQSTADGTLQVLNLNTQRIAPYASGLTMPNGLAVARNGNAFVTRDLGTGTGITRIAASGRHKVTTKWSPVSDTNGIAINHKNTTIYVDRTFVSNAPILAVPMNHPSRAKQIADLSAIAIGTGHGWTKGSLFVSGFDGTVRELDPVKS